MRLAIEQRGGKLSLRGKFPPRSGEGLWRQQYFALNLDATEYGVKTAQRQAITLYGQLENKTFRWANYGLEDQHDCRYWIDRYKKHWFDSRTGGDSDREWRIHVWNQGLTLLPLDEPVTAEMLISACKTKADNTRSRELTCQTLARFAKFVGIEVDLMPYRGAYKKAQTREIPTDTEIVAALDKIPSPEWQLVYKRMAIYGLRDHEVWHCEINSIPPHDCTVVGGKTGRRTGVMPLYPEWAVEWQPWFGELPQINHLDGFRICSDRTSKAFRRYGVGFRPYDLRHAWCLRGTISFKISLPVMAAMAGHSPEVHLRTYNKWISEDLRREAYLAAIANPNAPKAPIHLNDL